MADVDLVMTAVVATPVTLGTLRARLRSELRDEDESRWSDGELGRHLERAVRELSLVWPRERRTEVAAPGGTRELSLAGLEDLVRVEAVEFPVGEWPPSYAQFAVWQGVLTLLADAIPAADAAVKLFWGQVHRLTAELSTLPVLAEEAVVTGASGYAALEWSSFATNRANVAGRGAVADYERFGRLQLERFREALGRFGREAQVRTAAAYGPERPVVRRDVVAW